jgi:aspartyl-tRNA synthetase
LVICDVTEVFKRDDVTFNAFKGIIEKGGVVRAIRAPNVSSRPRSFFDKINDWAKGEGAVGLGYILFEGEEGKGPIAKFVPPEAQTLLRNLAGLENGGCRFLCL